MDKSLIVIESPNKIKTIQKYVGDGYDIIATVGHIRDIPASNKVAFDSKTYQPNWKVVTKPHSKQPIINEIIAKAKKAKKIYLASDPDREGEAISWHVYDILADKEKAKCVRITFNEITKEAIEEALKKEREINIDWVQSQFARRILDRIIGYDLSRFVRNKYSGSSAGRVQSVVLKFLNEREKEIEKFVPQTWFTLDVKLENDNAIILRETNKDLSLNVDRVDDEEKGTGVDFKNAQDAQKVKDQLSNEYEVYLVDPPKAIRRGSKDPYKTSTLQQDAVNQLGWSLSKITKVIQDLYEGIMINGEPTALITYPRTDSTRMSEGFVSKAKAFIVRTYGEEYAMPGQRVNKKLSENAQDAHECIRVIEPTLTPSSLRSKIEPDYFKMYDLIWKHTIASLMSQSIVESTIIRFMNKGNKFYTYSRTTIFDGFRIVYKSDKTDNNNTSKKYALGQKYKAKSVDVVEHVSKPPERYTQASLIKTLDESGVGRPSTYKIMADVGLDRGYCEFVNKAYKMLPRGSLVIDGLTKNFNDVIDKQFTKEMEERLDLIAENKEPWNKWIISFVPKFESKIADVSSKIEAKDVNVNRDCLVCGKPLVYRFSKKSKKQFIGCSGFPTCKYVEFANKPEILEEKCPRCQKNLVVLYNKRNKKFIGCTGYPNCNFMKPYVAAKKEENNETN